jgi:poly-gamma-glutamate synthesis protein (capsule biosynthesis protein)
MGTALIILFILTILIILTFKLITSLQKRKYIIGIVCILALLAYEICIVKQLNIQSDISYADDVAVSKNIVDEQLIYDNENKEAEPEIIEEETKEDVIETSTVNIKMVGDCLIHSLLYKAAYQSDGTYNFDNMFEHVKDDIESADLAIINQETIFTADRNNYSSYPMFGSPVEVGDAEVKAGFDIICHATNHTIDKGIQGITDTLTFWNENYPDIRVLGIHGSADESDIQYIEKNDINFAFVNYTYGLNGLESRRAGYEYMVDLLSDSDIEETLAEAEENADLTVAILHVGTEYVYEPTDYEQRQVDKFIDNGADIVLCAHPHVVEPYEIRTTDNGNSGLVYYSLGNFISNQDEVPRLLGGMADITITKTGDNIEISSYDFIPLVTHQEKGYYTTYKLEDYTDELASRQKLNVTVDELKELWNDIVGNN